ncbi:MAG: NIL domain-containing protein [Mojavia pulchra JT2-VF2]|uniref:NIL domain-containing protein n=1 Tax=Mojavia pulchra JT2-VF2 TaxID=287848 RepID=A0A951UHH9_9NOST|nr:NIL domain-containing protein [Mojavia pulchra JT2-VF2]
MTAFNNFQLQATTRLSLVPSVHEKSNITQIRLRVYISNCYLKEPIISRLTSNHGLVVNIIRAMLQANTDREGYFDLQLRGTVPQICSGLVYLEHLNLTIIGKPNVDGDGWHC